MLLLLLSSLLFMLFLIFMCCGCRCCGYYFSSVPAVVAAAAVVVIIFHQLLLLFIGCYFSSVVIFHQLFLSLLISLLNVVNCFTNKTNLTHLKCWNIGEYFEMRLHSQIGQFRGKIKRKRRLGLFWPEKDWRLKIKNLAVVPQRRR